MGLQGRIPHGTPAARHDVIVCGKSPEQTQPSVARYRGGRVDTAGRASVVVCGQSANRTDGGSWRTGRDFSDWQGTAFLAVGLFEPGFRPFASAFCTRENLAPIDRDWWRNRAADTLKRGEGLFDAQNHRLSPVSTAKATAGRGLVFDLKDGDTLVLKIYTAGKQRRPLWWAWSEIARHFMDCSAPCPCA